MDKEDIISIVSDDSGGEEHDTRAVLEPAIRSVVDALGGYENSSYRLGDECYGCLKDLKKIWRKDDTDDERTVARIFWETRVLPNDLVPILLETAGKGALEDKRAIACADLMTAMTWPIDLAEELRELDEEFDKGTDYTQLLISHLHYKAALLKPGVMGALFGLTLPCLAKTAKERQERDVQIINLILYLIRNLAFIKDLPANLHSSTDHAEFSTLQSRLIKVLSETHTLDLLLTIASNAATDPMFNGWNVLILEIFYLLFRGVAPSSLAPDQTKQPAQNLQRLLAVEDQRRRDFTRKATSRHSRFGTTISVKLNHKKAPAEGEGDASTAAAEDGSRSLVLHRQQAIKSEVGGLLDMSAAKRQAALKGKKLDELGREDNLSLDARQILQNLARTFIEACFNPLLSSLLRDIKAERPKVTEKDNLRLLYVAKWFLEFFLCVRAKEGQTTTLDFGLIAEVTERAWIVWVLRRMREAVEDKPKLWTELQAGIECLTQLVLAIDGMGASDAPDVVDAAEVLQQQIIYNGELLDIALESLRTYREGTQSLAYLDASVHLAYALLRMLERWGRKRGGEMYVRRKAKKKARRKNKDGEDGVPDVEEEEPRQDEEIIHETMFSFEMFEMKFAHADITQTLLMYLSRYKEFSSPEKMKRVVNLIHRQAVRAKAEGLFFQVSTLELFKRILADQKSLPQDRSSKDLVALITYILRQFFKAVTEDSFLIIEAFFPKTRGAWKQYSSWEPEPKTERSVVDSRLPPDVQVKKGYSWSEQLGIAVGCLVEDSKKVLVEWTKQILTLAIGERQRIIEDTDGSSSRLSDDEDGDKASDSDDDAIKPSRGPSNDAIAKFTDYLIPYVSDEEANAATKDPHLKLVFRLLNFAILDDAADEFEWYIPAAILPAEMQRNLNVINQFLEHPLDLSGKKASEMLTKKRRSRRRRRAPSADGSSDEEAVEKKRKKKKETKQYKSAQFIDDSDVEYGDMETFLAKEKALRERMALAAATSGQIATMKPTGTKKRRRKTKEDGAGTRKRKRGKKSEQEPEEQKSDGEQDQGSSSDSDPSDSNIFGSPKRSPSTAQTSPREGEPEVSKPAPQPRPRPRPRPTKAPQRRSSDVILSDTEPSVVSAETKDVAPRPLSVSSAPGGDSDLDDLTPAVPAVRKKGRLQLVVSDDEE
ncbi:timeless-domain-containing protein [Obba rivulosa]|uniref:Timeless-domain-containing protein n=1 Tax=Obba rivulosa TaxID=1052685 RepID=A0A8E2AMZ8_9APHY|nr:timeless-domain-containing protein [Obba rivulosa]